MRRMFSLYIMSMLMGVAWGQTYSYRYWLDNDDAMAKSGSASGETQFDLDLKTVAAGLHALHVQVKNSDDVWSSTRTRYFMNTAQQTAATARYWLDNDLATMHDGVSTIGTIEIDASLLTVGVHTIHYQTFSVNGTPSAVRTRYLYVNKVHRDILTASVSIDGGEATTHRLADGDIVIDIGELSAGEHTLKVELTDSQGLPQGTKETTFTVGIRGDVNNDNAVDIGDIVMVISVMTGTETNAEIVVRADVNSDGAVDIGDIVSIIDIMTAQPAGARAIAPRLAEQQTYSDRIDVQLTGSDVLLTLNEWQPYTAFQLTLSLPEGTAVDGVAISPERSNGHVATVQPLSNGQYLVMGYSLQNKPLRNLGGPLLTISTIGREPSDVALSNVVFATADGQTFRPSEGVITGIEQQFDNSHGLTQFDTNRIYDLQGRTTNSEFRTLNIELRPGIYIIDGKKSVVK